MRLRVRILIALLAGVFTLETPISVFSMGYGIEQADAEIDTLIQITNESIQPYLDLLGCETDSGSFTVTQEFLDNIDKVEVMGKIGTVSHGMTTKSATQIRLMEWVTNDTYTNDEFMYNVLLLNRLFGSFGVEKSYSNIDEQTYVWECNGNMVLSWFDDLSSKINIRWDYIDNSVDSEESETEDTNAVVDASAYGKLQDIADSKFIEYMTFFDKKFGETGLSYLESTKAVHDTYPMDEKAYFLDCACLICLIYPMEPSGSDNLLYIDVVAPTYAWDYDELKETLENELNTQAKIISDGAYLRKFIIDIPSSEFAIVVSKRNHEKGIHIYIGYSSYIEETYNISEKSEAETEETSTKKTEDEDASGQGYSDTHYCIVSGCNKIATQSISGFNGQPVYYCDEHYNHIKKQTEQLQKETSTNTIEKESNSKKATDAKVCAVNVVEQNLKSPSTAKFCSYPDMKAYDLGSDKWKVTGYVDAENSFGATVREYFTVTLTLTTSGYKDASVTFN